MGSVAIETPSSERVEPGSFHLKIATYPSTVPSPDKSTDAGSVATSWVQAFKKVINTPDVDAARISELFLSEAYWRDQLCLSWDFHCLGPEKVINQLRNGSRIKSMALDQSSSLRSPTATVLDADGKVHIVQAFLIVETDVGKGAGIVRLVQDGGKWKAFTLFTFLKELKGHEELVGKKRPFGVEHGEHASRQNWLDRRNTEKNFEDGQEPTVLILGK